MNKGQGTGINTGSYDISPERRARRAAAKRREEKRWARKSGPVTVRFVCPICGGAHAKSDHFPSRTDAQLVECPTCGAAPGEKCIGSRGQQRTANHRERIHNFTRQVAA